MHTSQHNSQNASHAQVNSSSKVFEIINPATEAINDDQSNEYKEMLDLFKQNGEIIEPCRTENSELSDIEFLKKVLDGDHAAFFFLRKSAIEAEKKSTPFN